MNINGTLYSLIATLTLGGSDQCFRWNRHGTNCVEFLWQAV